MPTTRFSIRLTQDEFASTAAYLRLGGSTLEIAQKALVDQAKLADLVKEYGRTPEQINKIVQRVYDEWNRRTPSSRVSSEIFETAVAKRPRLAPQSIEIARRALVDGEEYRTLAEEYGLTSARIGQIVKTIYADCEIATVAPHLTETQFKDAVAGRRFTDQTLQIAHAVLVRGESMPDVAQATGMSRQWIHKAVKTVHDAFLARENIPPGWVTETVTAPKDMLSEFRAAVEKKRKAYFSDPS
ncbi:TrfB-related DNA-binding protein [Burkholderia gladioli]|uniref:ParR n=1 Tax=Burkholderia gladioli (strain BSR3) TaxID=999541 RepID=F2LSB9_BURGS|nr:TrfB-related DNA-binding protein [Burkholderia gladioli]AEA65715.1 parR [Burkholderia gladioli BSR3]